MATKKDYRTGTLVTSRPTGRGADAAEVERQMKLRRDIGTPPSSAGSTITSATGAPQSTGPVNDIKSVSGIKATNSNPGTASLGKITYNGMEYDAPSLAWTDAAPSEWRETPERLEARLLAGYDGAGWKSYLAGYDSLSPLEQDIVNNVIQKQSEYAAAVGGGGSGGTSQKRSTAGTGGGKTAGTQAPAFQYNAERPAYTPQYQGYIDGLLGKTLNYGQYNSPFAGRIANALSGIENYGPYNSPYAEDIGAAISGIKGYGPYESPYAEDIAAALNGIKGYGDYVSPYAEQIDAQLAALTDRDPFSYDYTQDPAWQAYKKQYTREGRRATEDTLGQYAAMTGGMPSTAAVSAAQQAGNYYNAQMTDKIPELYKLAYSMYQDEGNNMLNNLNTLRGMDSESYGRYADSYNRMLSDLSALQGQDAAEYGRYGDQYNRMLTDLNALRGLDADEYGRYGDQYDRLIDDFNALRAMDADEYGRYGDRYNQLVNGLGIARGLEGDNYNRYRDSVSDWDRDRSFAYNVYTGLLDDAYRNQVYQDQRADVNYEREQDIQNQQAKTDAQTIYAYSSGGGDPYKIGTGKGQQFVQNSVPGDTMTGGDGSQWANIGGQIVITKGGQTWTIGEAPAQTPTYNYSYGGGGETPDYPVNMGDVMEVTGGKPLSAEKALELAEEKGYVVTLENGEYRLKKSQSPSVVSAIKKKYPGLY